MRDPLHWLPVKYKLALTFIGVCLLAFGVGGYYVWTSSSAALEKEIGARLKYQCRAYAASLDDHLRLYTRRAEDFSSDGYIRERAAALSDAPSPEAAAPTAADLRRHLLRNKLPLVPAFIDLTLLRPGGGPLVSARETPSPHLGAVAAALADVPEDAPWHSGILLPTDVDTVAVQVIAVPLRSLDGTRVVARLVAWVRSPEWIAVALGEAGRAHAEEEASVELSLRDGRGRVLLVAPLLLSPDAPAPDSELVKTGFGVRVAEPSSAEAPDDDAARFTPKGALFSAVYPIATNGWSAHVQLRSQTAFSPVVGLQSRFLVAGLLLALAIGVILYFPMRFVARPLVELREAARRIRDGDFGARVQARSEDEIGEQSRSFNTLVEAIGARTRSLEVAAQEIAAQRDRLDGVIASMRDGLVVLDADGKPVLSNEAARPLLDVLSRPDRRVSGHFVCEEGGTRIEDCSKCLFDVARPLRSCIVDQGSRVLEIHAARLAPGPDGRAGRVMVARDITARMNQDEQQIHQERLSVLGEVAAVMAHELNNPLAAIQMFAQMVGEGLPPESQYREHVSVILRNTDAAKRAIRELLDYATGASPDVGLVDVHDTLDDVARFVRPVAERSRVTIERDLAAKSSVVRTDEIQIRQVFVNLIMNAVQAMGSRGGTVRLSTRNEGEHFVVDVTDTGPGVPEELRQRIFDPFFTTKESGLGTGLGLPTARRIAEMHGGGLDLVEAEPGRTTFRLRLRTAERASLPKVPA